MATTQTVQKVDGGPDQAHRCVLSYQWHPEPGRYVSPFGDGRIVWRVSCDRIAKYVGAVLHSAREIPIPEFGFWGM